MNQVFVSSDGKKDGIQVATVVTSSNGHPFRFQRNRGNPLRDDICCERYLTPMAPQVMSRVSRFLVAVTMFQPRSRGHYFLLHPLPGIYVCPYSFEVFFLGLWVVLETRRKCFFALSCTGQCCLVAQHSPDTFLEYCRRAVHSNSELHDILFPSPDVWSELKVYNASKYGFLCSDGTSCTSYRALAVVWHGSRSKRFY